MGRRAKDQSVEHRLREAEALLGENDVPRAKEHLEWIKLQKELAETRDSRSYRWWAIGIALTCVLILSLLTGLRKPTTSVTASVLTRHLQFRLAKGYDVPTLESNSFRPQRLSLRNARTIDVVPLSLPAWEPGKNRIDLMGQGILWTEWRLDEGAKVEVVQTRNEGIRYYLKEGAMTAVLLLEDSATMLFDGTRIERDYQQGDPPDFVTVTFEADQAQIPFLEASSAVPMELSLLPLKELSFTILDEQDETTSGILSGEVALLEIGKTHTLGLGHWLTISLQPPLQSSIQVSHDGLKVDLASQVTEIGAGIRGYLRDIKPTWLMYLYHNEGIILLWSSFLSISGLLWSLKKLL